MLFYPWKDGKTPYDLNVGNIHILKLKHSLGLLILIDILWLKN